MTEPVRLAKRLAEILQCSRREAEQYIEGGWVTVDGVVVEEPQYRVAEQVIEVARDASLLAPVSVTMLLHKPAGHDADLALATHSPDDRSGIRQLKKHFAAAEMVTPLAFSAGGLVVFTDNWRVARKLREDAALMEHEVIVEVSGEIRPGGLERLNRVDHGFTFNGVLLPPARVSWQNETRLRFALKGGLPGQIAYLCESVGLKIEAMKRIRIGRVPMGQLAAGQWRYLLPHERF
ncbi:MAG: rRNA pseudouridine synthase [Pseudomonadota bacterium]